MDHVMTDADKYMTSYFSRFNTLDQKLRNCTSSAECMRIYKKGVRPMQLPEAQRIQSKLQEIDALCKARGFHRLLTIPWKFLVSSDSLENGFPHTHGDIIVLPQWFLKKQPNMKTLLHEKIHIYQRKYPFETHRLLCDIWGFVPVGISYSQDQLRANPDTNQLIYTYQGKPLQATYKNEATEIGDVLYNHSKFEIPADQRDHPFEVMACVLSDVLLLPSGRHPWEQSILAWAHVSL